MLKINEKLIKIKNQYQKFDKKQINTIVVGIWNKFTTVQKIKIKIEISKII